MWHSAGDDPLYLKHGTGRVADDIADEAARLRWLAPRLPCAAIRLFVTDGDAACLVTEAVAGRTGDALLADAPQCAVAVARAAARFMAWLHALPVDDCPFEAGYALRLAAARRNVAAGLVDTSDFDDDHRGISASKMLAATARLMPDDPCRVVTHGDLSLGNLLFDATGTVSGCIDVGRLGVADPYQDIAILWANLAEFGPAAQEALLAELGIVPDERRLTFHRRLDELF